MSFGERSRPKPSVRSKIQNEIKKEFARLRSRRAADEDDLRFDLSVNEDESRKEKKNLDKFTDAYK